MIRNSLYKKILITTTAIIGVAPALSGSPAYAQNLSAGEHFIVDEGSTVSGNPAVNLDGAITSGSITNFGTITSDVGFGILLNNGTLTNDITNHDKATVYGGIDGIRFNSYGSITGNIDNSGVIIGQNTAISIYGAVNGDIINNTNGLISGGATGIHASGGVMNGAIINHSGATISGDEVGISIDNATNLVGGINNMGTISGFEDGAPAGTSAAVFVQNARISGGITNSGIINGHGNTAIRLNGLTGATPITINGGRIIGDVIDDTPNNGFSILNIVDDFSTEGDFTVSDLNIAAGQQFKIGATNTVTLNDMSASAGTLSLGVNAVTPSYRLIVINGDIDISGTTVAASQIYGPLNDGDIIQAADGNAAVTGGPGATPSDIADESILWDFQLVDGTYGSIGGDSSELYMLVSQGSSGNINDIANTPNNLESGSILNNINGTSDPELSSIITNLNNANTEENVNEIIDSVNISPNRALVMNSKILSSRVRSIIQKRLTAQRTGISSGDEIEHTDFDELKVWGQVYNSKADQGIRNNVAGYKAHTTGVAVGVDTDELHENVVLGFSTGYSHTEVNSKDANSSLTNIDSYQATVYGDYDLDKDIFIKGAVGYVYNNNKTKRYNVGGINGLTAQGDHVSHYIYADAELGRNYTYNNSLIIPALTVLYGKYNARGYTETGAGGANLQIGGNNVEIFEVGTNINMEWSYNYDDGSTLKPHIHFGYGYDLIGENIETTSRFTGDGTSFAIKGADPARSTLNLGTGVLYQYDDFWTFEFAYAYEHKDDYRSNSFLLQAQYEF